MEIFLVEDDKNLNRTLHMALYDMGFNVRSFMDGKEALDNILDKYDLYILDMNLPNINGIQLIKKIKELDISKKIFVVSAELDIHTILSAYDIGATDYIKKPFDVREILVKINHHFPAINSKIIFKNCPESEYCINNKIFYYKGKEYKITKKESRLLKILIDNANKNVSNSVIENYVWNDGENKKYVRQLVAKLRKKLPCNIIENHTLNGYRVLI